MKKLALSIGACAALVLSIGAGGAVLAADNGNATAVTSGSTKPHLGNGPADEKSLPSSAASPSTTAKTGSTNQDNTVKSMNNNAKNKVEAEGK